ncbi:hypothetical protein JXA56_05290 [Candidatus Micrarchaeota archaeon]|nr:hypothetical protein [Candidatus Micrarchaeota archaeon]
MRKLLFILILVSASMAQSCLDFEDATSVVLEEQGTNIILVMIITVIIIAITFMAGQFIGNPGYTVFAKDEAYHLGFSVILLVTIGGVLVTSCYIMDFFYISLFENLGELPSGCYMQGSGINSVSSCYIRVAESDAKSLSESYIKNYLNYMMDSTFSYSIQLPLVDSYTATAGAYKRIISSQYDIVLNSFLVPALMSISMQKLALDFINENLVRWILPTAFFLRIFIPTRSIGNILIAVVVALYVVVPFMYVFNFAMYDAVFDDCHRYQDAVCDNVVDSYSCDNSCNNPEGFWRVARLVPQAFFLPNLTIALVVAFLTAANKALRTIG